MMPCNILDFGHMLIISGLVWLQLYGNTPCQLQYEKGIRKQKCKTVYLPVKFNICLNKKPYYTLYIVINMELSE